jgi:histidinol-phosphatase (PHP family)
VEKAIEKGLKTLGFSDHAPLNYTHAPIHYIRMSASEIDDYAKSITDLKKEYAKDIRILLGFELEYFPKTHEKEMEFLRSVSPDYILLGQHYFESGKDWLYSGSIYGNDELLHKYVSIAIEGLETGDFLYVAHPDLPSFEFSQKVAQKEYLRLCESAKKCNIPLEINFAGIQTMRSYPDKRFWEIAGQVGNRAIFGVDAHRPSSLLLSTEIQARALANEYGVEIIEEEML